MNKPKIKSNKKAINIPTLLDFKTIAYARGILSSKKQLYSLEKIKAGAKGEETLLDYLKKYGKKDWMILQNLWLNYYGTFECDLILLTTHKCYVFEVKNHTGLFNYEDGVCKRNNEQLSSNYIQQTMRATVNVRNICQKIFPKIKVQGVLVFVGIDNHIEINSNIGNIKVIQRSQLLNFIQEIVYDERNTFDSPINNKKIIEQLRKYKTENPFIPKPVTKEQMIKVRKGIYCKKCISYSIEVKKYKIICKKCHYIENRREAVFRTSCDYGVLNFDKNLKTGELFDFFDGQVGRRYLIEILTENFIRRSRNNLTYYENIGLPYSKLHNKA